MSQHVYENGESLEMRQPVYEHGQSSRSHNNHVQQRNATNAQYNCAQNFSESHGFQKLRLPPPSTCRHCATKLFHLESKKLCCLNGKTNLPPYQHLSNFFSYSHMKHHKASISDNIFEPTITSSLLLLWA